MKPTLVRLGKVAIWRLISIFITLSALYITTGDMCSATSTTAFVHILLTGAQYVFEVQWDKRTEKRKWEGFDESW
jgi:uncharacterized membrane protein